MEKEYIIKAYDDGKFYGYVAPHPEEADLPYYDNDKSNAMVFKDYSEADDWIEMYGRSGTTLDFTICRYFSKDTTLAEYITEWVNDNYGENEADNPSWNIEALADGITEFLKNEGE